MVYSGLDNARYYVPDGIDDGYLIGAINHVNSFVPGLMQIEIYNMYTDTTHPHFLDFKEYGTASMPGTADPGSQIYYSESAEKYVESSWYEPFGNFVYGFVLTAAGLSPEEIWFWAAAMSEGGGSGFFADDPQDQPHVNFGIAMAQQYAVDQDFTPVTIIPEDVC